MNSHTCTNCGAEVTGGHGACLLCGTPLTGDSVDPGAGVAAPPAAPPGTRPASALDVEVLALAIEAGQVMGALSAQEAENLRAELMGVDTVGVWWTFVENSNKWFRSEAGAWVVTEAPGEIYLEDGLHRRLQKMTRDTLGRIGKTSAPPPSKQPDPVPTQPEETPQFCGKCGQPARPGKKFCVSCGAPAGLGA